MITESSVEIHAPAPLVWEVFTDVERWSHWTASVTSLRALGSPAIEIGHRFEIKQPRMPKLVWEVTEVEPGVSWSWVQRSPGGTTVASHELIPTPGGTLVRQRIDQRGPVGVLVGALMRRLTRRYLDLEAQGLKTTSEARRQDATSA